MSKREPEPEINDEIDDDLFGRDDNDSFSNLDQ